MVLEQLQGINPQHVLLEPCMRNTAPCVAYVSWKIQKEDPEALMVVAPSDHLVLKKNAFKNYINKGFKFLESWEAILTMGMKPMEPNTGYGYIEQGKEVFQGEGIYELKSFREKPDLKTAQQYIQKSNYFWNAGIFIWNVSTIVNAFRVYQPKMAKIFESLMPIFGTEDEQQIINEKFPQCENISVDYAIMEKADEIFVCPADFGWSDLGTWGSLQQQTPRDLYGNAVIGNNVSLFDTRGCIIHTTQEKKVVIQGLDGYIVAEQNDTLLICKLSEEQRIKQFSGEN